MFKIGDFSRLARVTVRALRHYDEIDLFKPVEVDDETGYRYYSSDQLPRLKRIKTLKDTGFTLDEVALILDNGLSKEQVQEMYLRKKRDFENQITKAESCLAQIEFNLNMLGEEVEVGDEKIELKKVPTQLIASIRGKIHKPCDLQEYFHELYPVIATQLIGFAGPPMCIVHDSEFREEDIDAEAAVVVTEKPKEIRRVKARELESELVVSTIHYGSYNQISVAYESLMRWIEDNGYCIAGNLREIYIASQWQVNTYQELVTEVQMPVKK